jgi:hypothetical protein
MANRLAFLARPKLIILILLAVMCLLVPVEAQHGSGGGHSAGGHFGGGHSSRGHTGGGGSTGARHLGWLHFGFGNRSARRAGGLGAVGAPDASRQPPELVRGTTPVRAVPSASIQQVPPRSLPVLFPARFARNSFFFSSQFRHHPRFFFGCFRRFPTSGCFFNGLTQMCFFEPALSLVSFSAAFDSFPPGFGFDGNSKDIADDLNSLGTMQPGIAASLPTASAVDTDTSALTDDYSPTEAVGKGFFLLVLKNGSNHAVTDYWLADGYLEYVSLDSARSHIPLEALDLQKTVLANSRRGLPFVLRSAPEDER